MNQSSTRSSVHILKVSLKRVSPPVWRRLQVPSAITLGELHDVLQVAFGWDDDHLHMFEVRGRRYGPPELVDPLLGGAPQEFDEDVVALATVAGRVGSVLEYTYDLGDDWLHTITVERVDQEGDDRIGAVCTAGRGLAPEQDTGEERLGRFDELARKLVNAELERLVDTGSVVELKAAGAEPAGRAERPVDPVFDGLFAELDQVVGECPCGCGASRDEVDLAAVGGAMPVLDAAPDAVLAGLAAGAPLVRQAVALANWLGSGRAVTKSELLKPADARAAAVSLGLEGAPEVGGVPVPPPTRVRSAKDLPGLHAVWTAAREAGLIDVRRGVAYPGSGVAVWDGPALPVARIESWAALLAGYLRTRSDPSLPGGRGWSGYGMFAEDAEDAEDALASSVPLLYAAGKEPVSAGVLAVGATDLDDEDDVDPLSLLSLPVTVGEMGYALAGWLAAGVVAPVSEAEADGDPDGDPDSEGAGPRRELGQLVATLQDQLDDPRGDPDLAMARVLLAPMIDALTDGPWVRLTPLGEYGLARILTAHGWRVLRAGDLVDVEPERILDRLTGLRPHDAMAEAVRWVQARGGEWQGAVRAAGAAAAVPGAEGPARRSMLLVLLAGTGPQAAPLLREWRDDAWLGVPVSAFEHLVGTGTELTLAQRLWLNIDSLSAYLDDTGTGEFDEDAEDDVLTCVDDVGLAEDLAQPGGIDVAVSVAHPRAREVLLALVDVLDDGRLASRLDRALREQVRRPRGIRRRR